MELLRASDPRSQAVQTQVGLSRLPKGSSQGAAYYTQAGRHAVVVEAPGQIERWSLDSNLVVLKKGGKDHESIKVCESMKKNLNVI